MLAGDEPIDGYNWSDGEMPSTMSSDSLSLADLEGCTTDSAEEMAGEEPTYFRFVFYRDDTDLVEKEGYAEAVSPVHVADSQKIRALEDEGWRYFATVHTPDTTWSEVRFLFEHVDGEIHEGLIENEETVEMLHPVTIAPIDD
jgi:hypothetical protein